MSSATKMRVRQDRGAILSHDAFGADDGQLSLYYDPVLGGLMLRGQRAGEAVHRCAASPTLDQWLHVGINVSSELELWGDGQQRDELSGEMSKIMGPCGDGDGSIDLSGGTEFWTLGATNHFSRDGELDLREPMVDGLVDNLRFSNVVRDFTGITAP